MDEKVAEEIRMHKETIATDSNTPLHLIREKEIEISGRVLAAKREADEVVAEARKKAAEVLAKAEAEGGEGAAKSEAVDLRSRRGGRGRSCERTRSPTQLSLPASIDAHRAEAVRLVLDAVTTI